MLTNLIALLLGLLSFCNSNSWAQIKEPELVGIWQAESDAIGSGWNDNYQLFAKGQFIFNLSQKPFGLERIVRICGRYDLRKDTLYLKVNSTFERAGGRIIRVSVGEVDAWNLVSTKISEKVQPQPNSERAYIKVCTVSQTGIPCISIDGRSYYRVRMDPHQYP